MFREFVEFNGIKDSICLRHIFARDKTIGIIRRGWGKFRRRRGSRNIVYIIRRKCGSGSNVGRSADDMKMEQTDIFCRNFGSLLEFGWTNHLNIWHSWRRNRQRLTIAMQTHKSRKKGGTRRKGGQAVCSHIDWSKNRTRRRQGWRCRESFNSSQGWGGETKAYSKRSYRTKR
jgi:hypothetical protein